MGNFKNQNEGQTRKNYFLFDELSGSKQLYLLNQERMLKRLADYKDEFSFLKRINRVFAMFF